MCKLTFGLFLFLYSENNIDNPFQCNNNQVKSTSAFCCDVAFVNLTKEKCAIPSPQLLAEILADTGP